MFWNGWPSGRVGPGGAPEGSIKLVSSGIDGRRQPFWPPTVLLMQMKRATLHLASAICGDFSQTSPVLLSRTASLVNAVKITNRSAAGSTLSQFCVWPAYGSSLTGGAAVAGVVP